MEKIDLKKKLSHLYKPSAKVVAPIDVPEMKFIMIDGAGDPNNSKEFSDAVEALFALSYNLKFMVKKGEIGIDYGVMPLEGLWWAEDMSEFDVNKKGDWLWTLMIMQPEFITDEMYLKAVSEVKKKKDPVSLAKARFEKYSEGKAAQIMHIGPFSEEGPTIEKVHNYIADNKFERKDKHHEIYLSDIRKAAPEKWKTIIRQPFK